MKKYLLTLALSIIGFIGFTSASFTITNDNGTYSPSVVNFSQSTSIPDFPYDEFPDYVCNDPMGCCISLSNGVSNCEIFKDKGMFTDGSSCSNLIGDYQVSSCSSNLSQGFSTFDSIDVDISGVLGVNGDNGSSTISQVLPNGFSDLSPAISGIYDVIHQLLPFVVYIGIGVLIAVLGFYAIKWLMSYMSGKIRKYFK